MSPQPGDVLSDLVVRFGVQERNHCAFCKRYFKSEGNCACGAQYRRVDDGWEVVRAPTQERSRS